MKSQNIEGSKMLKKERSLMFRTGLVIFLNHNTKMSNLGSEQILDAIIIYVQ